MLVLPAATGAATMGGAGGVKTRLVKIGAANAGHAPHNRLVTAKFTLLNFLPLALFAQFRRVANLYFLLNGMLMMFAEVTGAFNSPYTSYTTLGPLMFLITISLINDALTDIQRHRADMRMDATAVDVVSRGGGQLRLANIRSGDVLRCVRGEAAPADFVMLAGSGEASTAYIDTASIDGETSLKLRRAAPLGLAWQACGDDGGSSDAAAAAAAALDGVVECDLPNEHVNAFTGNVALDGGGETLPLSKENVILRGSTVHSAWVVGVCIYSGRESKLAKNMREAPIKFSQLDRVTNRAVLIALLLQLCLAIISSGAMVSFDRRMEDKLWYTGQKQTFASYLEARWPDLEWEEDKASFGWGLCTFFILYCFFIPMSLYVTFDFAKIAQMQFIDWDEEMTNEVDGQTVRAKARSLCVTDLGLVERCHLERWARNPQEAPWGADLIHLRKDSKIAPA